MPQGRYTGYGFANGCGCCIKRDACLAAALAYLRVIAREPEMVARALVPA